MSLFRLDASIRVEGSASREIADIVEAEWRAGNPDIPVTRRQVGTEPLPSGAWAAAVAGSGLLPAEQSTPGQAEALALAAELAAELTDADAVLLAVPLYNFGVSQHFKTWIDLVGAGAGDPTGLLKDKPTALVTVRGGGYGPGTPREGWDHSTPYLRRILGDLWQADLTVIERELTLATTTPGMEGLKDLAAQLHTEALDAARHTGRALTAK